MPTFYRCRWSLLLGSVLLIYLVVFSTIPKTVFWGTDEGAKFIQLQTLLGWQGGAKYQVPYPGQRLDPAYRFYPHNRVYPRPLANGQVDFPWSIGFPLLSILPFKLLGLPGLYVFPMLSGILTTALSGWLAHRFFPAAAPLTMVAVGLASPIFFFSFLFWEHTLVVLIGLAALWQAMRLGEIKVQGRWLSFFFTGLLLASAIALRLEMLMYALALILASAFALLIHHPPLFTGQAAFRRGNWRRVTIAIVLITLGLLIIANFWPFLLDLLGPRHQRSIEGFLPAVSNPEAWLNLPSLLPAIWINNSYFIGPEIPAGWAWLGLAGLILGGLAILLPDTTSASRLKFLPVPPRWSLVLIPIVAQARVWLLVAGGLLVGAVSAYVLFLPSRYRTVHGLFLVAPYLVFMVLFLPYARRDRTFAGTVLATTTLLYLVFGTIVILIAPTRIQNLEWGPRYLLAIYPLAGICTGVGLYFFYQTASPTWSKRLLLGLAGLLLCLGIGYELRGLQEIQTTKKDFLRYAQTLALIDQPLVTDLAWLPALLATHFVNQEIYVLAQPEDLYAWLEMTGGQVDSFVFAGFFVLNPDLIKKAPYPLVPGRSQLVGQITFTEFKIFTQPGHNQNSPPINLE